MTLDQNYIVWLCDYLHAYECPDSIWKIEVLATIPFHWTLWLDENANYHGVKIREMYHDFTGMTAEIAPEDMVQASLLEVLVACARFLELECFYNHEFDGSYRWFWQAFRNIGFDFCIDEEQIYAIAERFMSRNYEFDGSGSMTGPIIDPKEDIRNTPILKQLKIWYVRTFM